MQSHRALYSVPVDLWSALSPPIFKYLHEFLCLVKHCLKVLNYWWYIIMKSKCLARLALVLFISVWESMNLKLHEILQLKRWKCTEKIGWVKKGRLSWDRWCKLLADSTYSILWQRLLKNSQLLHCCNLIKLLYFIKMHTWH